MVGLKKSGNKRTSGLRFAALTRKTEIVPQRYLGFARTLHLKQREFFMRIRTILLIIFIALVAGFVALNVGEFTRSSVLNLGIASIDVSLGLVMLLLLVVVVVAFLGNTLLIQSANLIESRKYARELNTQRDLADKAEASRFTELRHYLDAQAAAEREREVLMNAAIDQRFAAHQQVLLARLDQSDNTVAAHLGQLEDRLEHPSSVRVQS